MVKVGVKVSGYQPYNPDSDLENMLLNFKQKVRRVSKVREKGLEWKIIDEDLYLNNIHCIVVKFVSPFDYHHLYQGFLGFIASDILLKSLNKRFGKPWIVYMEKTNPSLKDYNRLVAKWIPRFIKLEKSLFIADSGIVSGLRKIISIRELEEHAYSFLSQHLALEPISKLKPLDLAAENEKENKSYFGERLDKHGV